MTNFHRNTNSDKRSTRVTHQAKAPSAGSTQATGSSRGLLRRASVTRGASSDSKGTGAPSPRSRRLRSTLATLALAIAAFAITAAPASAAPEAAKVETISAVSYTSAHVTGKVSSPGCGIICAGFVYSIQYSTDPSDETSWQTGFTETLGGAADEKPVGGNISVPKGGTKYFVRLKVDTIAGASATSPEPNPDFTTLTVDPPVILATDDASGVFSQSAQVSGEVERPANGDPAFDVSDCRFEYVTDADYAVQRSEVQELTVAATAGSFQLEFGGQKTSQIAFDASAATVQSALEALPGFPAGAIAVSGGPGDETASTPYIFTFGGALANQNAAQIRADGKELSGPGAAVNASTSTEGRAIGFEGAAEQKCEQPLPFETPEGKTPVTAHLTGLAPETTYHLRLAAENAAPAAATKEATNTFTTAPKVAAPTVIAADDATDVGFSTAKVSGEVQRPAGDDPALDTSCHFEYVTDEQFTSNPPGEEFAGAGQVECVEAPAEVPLKTTDPTPVTAELSGLPLSTTGTTYHLRLTAENGGGTTSKEAADTFTTLPSREPNFEVNPVAPADVGYTTAHVTGTVDIGEPEHFITFGWQVSTEPSSGTWVGRFENEARIPGKGEYSKDLTGLKPGTKYYARIIAVDNNEGTQFASPEPYESFTTKGTSAPPIASLDPITDFTATTAHFTGTVNPNGPAEALNDEAKAAYKTDWHIECTPACSGDLNGTVEAEEGSQAIDVDVKHLDTNTHYVVKLIAENVLGTPEAEQSFDTPLIPPTVKSLPGGSDGEGGYILAGVVNPNHSEITSCHFEWGPNSSHYDFDAPCSPAALGNGGQPVTVEAHLTGLNPGAVYNADLVIESTFGKDHSGNFEFTPTLANHETCPNEQLRKENDSLELPECRAYELVSLSNTEGRGVRFVEYDEGSAVAYESKASNLVSSGQGDVFHNFYVATRTPNGWETIPNLNGPTGSLQSAPEFARVSPGFYSADLLSSMWTLARADGSGGPSFRRPDGRFELLPAGFGQLFGASEDLSRAFMAGAYGPGLYEVARSGSPVPRRIDVDNSGDPASLCGASYITASTDGGVVFFTASGGGCAGGPPVNELWSRVGATTSFDVSRSQCTRAVGDPGGACNDPTDAGGCKVTPPIPGYPEQRLGCRDPHFMGAAKDGSRAYFTTTQQLVNGDTDETNDLYACDIPTAPPAAVDPANPCTALTEVSAGPAGNARVQEALHENGDFEIERSLEGGVSDDGSTAYFTAKGVLADNEDALGEEAQPGDNNLYVWRTDAAHPDGQTTFVARLDSDDLTAVVGAAPQVTPDGRYLIFTTTSQLVETDTDSARDVYRYDADSVEMARVSTGVSGAGGNGEFDARLGASVEFASVPFASSSTLHHSHFSISDNGELIVFLTSEPLSPLDGNGGSDAYLWNAGHVVGSLGQAPNAFIDGSGQDVYLDRGSIVDVRVGGGFPQPQEGCSGEACQPEPTSPPVPRSLASQGAGPGNPPPPKACPKGKVAKGNRCVKKPRKKHHRKGKSHAKRASHDRGGSK